MLKHDRIRQFIPPILLSILISMYYYSMYGNSTAHQAHILLLISYGGLVAWDGLYILQALAFCLPFFVQLFIFANSLNDEFGIACVYIFPRRDTRTKWLIKNYIKIALRSLIFYLVQFITVLIISIFLGYEFDLMASIGVIAVLLITTALVNTTMTLIACALSLRNRTSFVVSIFIGIYFASIFFIPLLKNAPMVLSLIPFSHAIALYHTIPLSEIAELSPPVETIPLWHTFIYMAVIAAVLLIISNLWIKKANLMEVE